MEVKVLVEIHRKVQLELSKGGADPALNLERALTIGVPKKF